MSAGLADRIPGSPHDIYGIELDGNEEGGVVANDCLSAATGNSAPGLSTNPKLKHIVLRI